MTSYSRQEVLRILQISAHQLQGWERAELIAPKNEYSFQDLGQLRTLKLLRAEDVPAASIRLCVQAMKAVSGMSNPLVEACVVRTGTRLAFRHQGRMVDPIRLQLLFDFERFDQPAGEPARPLRALDAHPAAVQERFLEAVQAEEHGNKQLATEIYEEIVAADPEYAPAFINLGTLHFHQRQFARAEELYRQATEADPGYVLAFFDLGNVLDELNRIDESIAAYQRAVELAPRYADVHYNLALAYERKGLRRQALRHWESYLRLDGHGPWADHARMQIRTLLDREKLAIAWRKPGFVARHKGTAALALV